MIFDQQPQQAIIPQLTQPVAPITPTPQAVYAAPNVVSAVSAPVAAPDFSDPLDMQTSINDELGIPDLEKTYQDIYAELQAFDQGTTGQQIAIEGQPVSMNVIRGEQAEAGRQRAFTREGMARKAQVAQSALFAAKEEAANRFNIANQQRQELTSLIVNNPGAGITYTDTPITAAAKINAYQEKQIKIQEEKAKQEKKDAYKDSLKQLAMQYGINTKGKSAKELKKKISKYYKEKGASDKEIKELNKHYKPKGTSKDDLTTEGTQGIESYFGNVKGQDGYVSPQDWAEAKSQWAKNGLTTSSFNAIFGKWKNPNDKYK